MRLTRTWNAGYDNVYLSKDDVDRLLKGQMIKESSLIVQMETPEREWVGLTEDERDAILRSEGSIFDETEAILKAKNT